MIGSPNAEDYGLPFEATASHELLQGYNGKLGHAGRNAFAYDFQMPIGTPVFAARAGKVIFVEERKKDATRKPGDENYVVIQHSDGTYARYYHLTKKGVKVNVGDEVTQNQLIALSGDSGASAGPHLHFDVTTGCFQWGCQTIQVNFQNLQNPLQEGKSC